MGEEFDKSPWGRKLHILAHRLPRDCREGADWELERGFHLQVIEADFFQLVLRARHSTSRRTVGILGEVHTDGQDRFLLWHAPLAYSSERLSAFAEKLRDEYTDHVGLILSHPSERKASFRDLLAGRGLWRGVRRPVIQVFQAYPRADFFSVEKTLFDLGRVGRRLQKLTKLRRFAPW